MKKAMIYPIAVCVVAIIVTVVMLVKVIPSYEDMFKAFGYGITVDYTILCEFEPWNY